MASKIYDNMVGAIAKAPNLEFVWDGEATRPKNIETLCRVIDRLEDPEFARLVPETQNFIDKIYDALQNRQPVPEFPDYVEDAPARRRRRAPVEAADDAPPARTRRAAPPVQEELPPARPVVDTAPVAAPAPAATNGVAAAAAPKGNPKGSKFARGERMYQFRKLVLENPTMTKKEAFARQQELEIHVSESTTNLIFYNTRDTVKTLKRLGLYDHEAALAQLRAQA